MTEATVFFEPAPSVISEMETDPLTTSSMAPALPIILVAALTASSVVVVPPLPSLDRMTEATVFFEPAPAVVTEVEADLLSTLVVVVAGLHIKILLRYDYYL